jgi:ribosomal protein L16 Arg81 hydroxylase
METTTTPTLPDAWQYWVADNLARGVPGATVTDVLTRNGFEVPAIEQAIAATRGDRHFAFMQKQHRRYEKLAWILGVQQRLRLQSASARSVPRVSGRLSREEFFENHYALNRPVVMTGAINDWPALDAWTLDYLKQKLGHHRVEIQGGRDLDQLYERNSVLHKRAVPFAEMIERIEREPTSNDFYMTANNGAANLAFLRDAFTDVRLPSEYCVPDWTGRAFFWFGPAGTITPLHHDVSNIIMAQVRGRKTVTLISPLDTEFVYNNNHCFSEVDVENVDAARFPLFARATILKVTIEPGDMLFLPIGWWHHVRSLDTAVTVSFTNFAAPNDFSTGYEHLTGDF